VRGKRCTDCDVKVKARAIELKAGGHVPKKRESAILMQVETDQERRKAKYERRVKHMSKDPAFQQHVASVRHADYMRIKEDPGRYIRIMMQNKIGKVLHGSHSDTLMAMTEFTSDIDIKNHFEELWEPGMSWDNYGAGDDDWQIGHKIPKCYFDHLKPADLMKGWKKKNLFPQWKRDNMKQNCTIPDDATLEELAICWPDVFEGKLPSQHEKDRLRMIALAKNK
jgi:hypothetical protein